MVVFFDCWSCFLFDTRVKFNKSNDLNKSPNDIAIDHASNHEKGSDDVESNEGNDVKRSHEGDTITIVDSVCEVDEDSNMASNSNDNSDSDSSSIFDCDESYHIDDNNDDDSSFVYDDDENCDIDDDCNIGPKETRSFLYRHLTIMIIANPTMGKLNLIFMKVTLLHIKGEDNKPRMLVILVFVSLMTMPC